MFPIVSTHLNTSISACPNMATATTSSDSSTSAKHFPIWNMWNTTTQVKPSRSAKKSAKLHMENNTENCCGCIAAINLPKDVHSEHLKVNQSNSNRPNENEPLRIGLTSRGVLRCENHPESNINWITKLQLADDVHSNNVIAELHRTGAGHKELRARIVRSIPAGDSMLLWFSEEVLAMMNIPFLTPACIRGKNMYTCQTCDETFESPNPLKIHMATNCSHRSLQELWMRVEYSLQKDNLLASAMTSATIPLLTIPSIEIQPSIPTNLPPTNISSWVMHQQYYLQTQHRALLLQHQHHHQQQQQRLALSSDSNAPRPVQPARMSAFQPVTTKTISESCNSSPSRTSSSLARLSSPYSPYPLLTPISSLQALDPTHQLFNHHHQSHHVLLNNSADANTAAAHLETIASNMGSSSNTNKSGGASGTGGGHICVYCGKAYSRKYGLKIHIRTHTGFKPLKCRFCFRAFGDPSNLNKHVRLHVQGSSVYKCPDPQCDKILVRRRDLQRHVQTRHSLMDSSNIDGADEILTNDSEDSDVEVASAERRKISSSPSSVSSSRSEVHDYTNMSTYEEVGQR